MIRLRGVWTDAPDPWEDDDLEAMRHGFCCGGGGGKSSGTQTSKVELPNWLEDAAKVNLWRAEDVGRQPYQSYGGDRIAGFTGDQLAAQGAIREMQGDTGAALGELGETAQGFGSWTPDDVTARQLSTTDLTPYMNPYTGEVEANALRALESSRQQAQTGNEDRFLSSKAFGGSRHALQSAVTDSLAAQQAGDLTAKLRQANFAQAQQAATGDITRTLQADLANQQAGIQGAGLNLQGLQLAGNLYNMGQAADIRDISLLDTVGAQQQAMDQANLDLQYQNWLDQTGWERSQVEWLQQMIGSSPGSQTTTISGNIGGSKGSPWMGAAGGAMSGAAMGTAINPGIGTAIGAVGGAILGGLGSR